MTNLEISGFAGGARRDRETDAEVLARLARERFTCRAFRPERVPDHVITEILETARRTPSWCNVQPWGVIITRGEGTDRFRDALYRHAAARPPEPDFQFP